MPRCRCQGPGGRSSGPQCSSEFPGFLSGNLPGRFLCSPGCPGRPGHCSGSGGPDRKCPVSVHPDLRTGCSVCPDNCRSDGPDSCPDGPGNYSGVLCSYSGGSGIRPGGHFSSGARRGPDDQISHSVRFSPDVLYVPDGLHAPMPQTPSPVPRFPFSRFQNRFQKLLPLQLSPVPALLYFLYFHCFPPLPFGCRRSPLSRRDGQLILLFVSR